MNKRIVSFLILINFLGYIEAQVTIGSATPPARGALLQLKENEGIDENSTRGLLLPRLIINDLHSLQELNVPNEEKLSHTGLLVFNLNEDRCKDISSGLLVWNGENWDSLNQEGESFTEVSIMVDVRSGDQVQNYKTGHFTAEITDGNNVKKKIDAGWWMLENLRATKFANGADQSIDIHFQPNHIADLDKYSFYSHAQYDPVNDPAKHGYYYSSRAIYNGLDMDGAEIINNPPPRVIQGICPEGWRIPTYEDWIALLTILTKDESCTYGFTKFDDNNKGRNAFSRNSKHNGIQGTSREAVSGGFDLHLTPAEAESDGMIMFPGAYPMPYQGDKEMRLFAFTMKSLGMLSPFTEIINNVAPVRCVKGPVPPQIEY